MTELTRGPRAAATAGLAATAALVATTAGVAVTGSAQADTSCSGTAYTWIGGGNWTDASSWSPAGVPGAADTVTVTSTGGDDVKTVDGAHGTVCALTITGPGTSFGATGLTVTGALTWQGGSNADRASHIYGPLSAGSARLSGHVNHNSEDHPGAIRVGSVVTDPGTVLGLGDNTSGFDVTTADLGSGTEIEGNSSSEFGEDNADLNVAAGGRLSAVSDVNMPGMNLNLGAGARLVGGGHTITLGGASESVWASQSTLANDGTTVKFTKWAKVVPQGFILPAKDRLLLTQGELLSKGKKSTARLNGRGQVVIPAGGQGFIDDPFVMATPMVSSGSLTLDYDARLTTTGSVHVTKHASLSYNGDAHWKVLGPLRVDRKLNCGSQCITLPASAKAKGAHAVQFTFAAVSKAGAKVKLTVSKAVAHKAKLHSRTIGTATRQLTASGTYRLTATIMKKLRRALHKRGRITITATLTQTLAGGAKFTSSRTVTMRVK